MGMTEQETSMMIPQQHQPSNSFDSASSSAMYTPKKKKQKIHGNRPPLAPTKNKSAISQYPPRLVEEESRCEQEMLHATRYYLGTQHRNANNMTGPTVESALFKDTLAPWNSPRVIKGKTTMVPDPPARYLLDEDERMPSLDGLELLETMSFDEYDCRQDNDDQSLSYSVISEG
jgi:hypothetical protein